MPEYNWRCLKCESAVPKEFECCTSCGCPSIVSVSDLESMHTIWDGNLSIRLDLNPAILDNQAFHQNRSNLSHIGTQLLLYDRIIIPTKDFGIVPILVAWFGYSSLIELFRQHAIMFLWQEFHIAYGSDGFGLTRCAVEEPDSGWENWQQVARWGGYRQAAEAQTINSLKSLTIKQRENLLENVINNCIPAISPNIQDLKIETANDLMANVELNHFLYAHEPNRQKLSLDHLSGIDANSIKIAKKDNIVNGVDLLLRVADINNELTIASALSCDLNMPQGTLGLLKGKLKRHGAKESLIEKFSSLLQLTKIPDIRPIIESGALPLSVIVRLRGRRKSRRFRRWLHYLKPIDAKDLCAAYVSSLESINTNRLPSRVIQAGITTSIGEIGFLEGFTSSLFGGLLKDCWSMDYAPKLFLDELRKLPIDD